MKKAIFIFLTVLSLGFASQAQCDKKINYSASKVEFLNAEGGVERIMNEKVDIEVTKTLIIMKRNNQEQDVLKGELQNVVCEWKEPFKNGKTTFKSELVDNNGEIKDCTGVIEAKEGKILITMELIRDGRQMKIYVDSYKEL